jgi:hypothetical protein
MELQKGAARTEPRGKEATKKPWASNPPAQGKEVPRVNFPLTFTVPLVPLRLSAFALLGSRIPLVDGVLPLATWTRVLLASRPSYQPTYEPRSETALPWFPSSADSIASLVHRTSPGSLRGISPSSVPRSARCCVPDLSGHAVTIPAFAPQSMPKPPIAGIPGGAGTTRRGGDKPLRIIKRAFETRSRGPQ